MRILVIANSESVHTARFANEFSDRGHEVMVLSSTPYLGRIVTYRKNIRHIEFLHWITKPFIKVFKKQIEKFNPANSKPYHPLNFLILIRMITLFFFINTILRKEKFDGVFATNLTTNGLFTSRIKRNVKKVCMTLGCDLRIAKWYSPAFIINNKPNYKYIYKNLDYIITGKEKQLIDFFNNKKLFSDSKKLAFINGLGVDTDRFSPKHKNNKTKKELYGIKENSILAVCFRQPRPNLDFEGIINSLSSVIEKYPNFYFAIGTGGIEFPHLMQQSKNLGIENNILFMENINYEDLHKYIAQGDIYIDPINIKKRPETKSAGISGSILEAMSCGLIPVSGIRPGFEAYFTEEHYSFFYNDMEKELSDYLLKAINENNNYDIKTNFRKIVINKSNWNDNVELVLQKY